MSSSGPLTTSKKRHTNVPISRNESSGSELVKHQQRVSTAGKFDQKDIGAVAKKDEKPNRRTGKDTDLVQKKKTKGEINLDKLRNKKMLNDIVEKQLSEICRKGKLFDIDITDCITQDSLDDSSDFSCLSHDHEQKRDLKKLKRILFSVRVTSRLKNTQFPNQQNRWIQIQIRILLIHQSQTGIVKRKFS